MHVTTQPVEIKQTYCRICMVQCGLVAEVAGDQILKVRGDREHPLTKGYTCPKGRATGQVHHVVGAADHGGWVARPVHHPLQVVQTRTDAEHLDDPLGAAGVQHNPERF